MLDRTEERPAELRYPFEDEHGGSLSDVARRDMILVDTFTGCLLLHPARLARGRAKAWLGALCSKGICWPSTRPHLQGWWDPATCSISWRAGAPRWGQECWKPQGEAWSQLSDPLPAPDASCER